MHRTLLALLGLILSLVVVSATPAQATHTDSGYWMLTEQGAVYNFGGAGDFGQPICFECVDIEPTPSGHGFWVLTFSGSVQTHGDAEDFGDPWPVYDNDPDEEAVSLSATPDGKGYWVFTNRGRVFAYGNARHFGDMAGVPLQGPVLDSVATPSGNGYWMVASDGGIFSFGDARFYGSMGGKPLNKPVMSMAPDPDGVGYWLVASDGGIFSFEGTFYGSMGDTPLNKPISGMIAGNAGYLMVAEDGGIFAFGDVRFHGSLPGRGIVPASPVAAVGVIGDPPPPPVYEWRTAIEFGGMGDRDSAPFHLDARVAAVGWSCNKDRTTPSSYNAGCIFSIYEYETGRLLDYVSTGDNQSGEFFIHPERSGRYYIQARQYSVADDAVWGVAIAQERCIQNCG